MKGLFVGKKLHTPKVTAPLSPFYFAHQCMALVMRCKVQFSGLHDSAYANKHYLLAACLQRSTEKWGANEIRRWTANAGLSSYDDVLAEKGGMVCSPASLPMDS